MIGMAKPLVGEEEIQAVIDVMRSGMLAAGPKVAEFENAFADFIGMPHGVASANGTTALHLALLALGVGENDKVLTTPFTFIASSNSILFNRAVPVFIDIDPSTYLIDPEKLESYLATHYEPSMKAILVVHLFGLPCDMPRIMEVAKKYNLKVIEDCAQSHGAEIQGVKAGLFGDASSFSFYPTKNMTTSEGGMTLFKNELDASVARKYANHGRVDQYLHDVVGYNYRMTSIAAAIGLVQLKKLNEFNAKRRKNAEQLNRELAGVTGLQLPVEPEGYSHVFHQYTVTLPASVDRDALQENLKESGVGSAVVYPFSMNHQPCYHDACEFDNLEVAEQAASKVLSLPVHPSLSEAELQKVALTLKTYIEGNR